MPAFNNGGGSPTLRLMHPGEAGLVCSFFEVVDGQTLIRGVSCFILKIKSIKYI